MSPYFATPSKFLASLLRRAGRALCLAAGRPVDPLPDLTSLGLRVARLRSLHEQLVVAGLGESYEATHARLVVRYLDACQQRMKMLGDGTLQPLASAESQYAADKSYVVTTLRHCDGLEKVLESYAKSDDSQQQRVYQLWEKSKSGQPISGVP